MNNKIIKISKYLSLILRHRPDIIGLQLDKNGWASIEDIIDNTTNLVIDESLIKQAVADNDKSRFKISEDGKRIKAHQGHSIKVDLDLEECEPPEFLYHGTATKNMSTINMVGLDKAQRHHVHLSSDVGTAVSVGKRHGAPIVLLIDAKKMFNEGFVFYKTENNVWLVDNVPTSYMRLID